MPMVQVRIVRVAMRHRRMPMPMTMRVARWVILEVTVLMVRIVSVSMLVLKCRVVVLVLVTLGQMKVKPYSHQQSGTDQSQAHFFAQCDGQYRAGKRRQRVIGARPRCPEVAKRQDEQH